MAANTPERIANSFDPDVDNFYNTVNLFADDGSYAYSIVTGMWFLVWWSNLNIPYQAKVTGVVIKLEHWDSEHCTYGKIVGRQSVQITFDGGATYSAAKTFPAATGPTIVTLGHSADLWGLPSPAPIKFNDAYDTGFSWGASFKVLFTSNISGSITCELGYGQEIRLDYVSCIVYYTMPDDAFPHMAFGMGTLSAAK